MFTEQEMTTLRANKIIPESATPQQVQYFFEVCKRKKLDPFLKQIHMIERNERDGDKWKKSYTIQSSLDGMRVIAQRNCKITSYRRSVRKDGDEVYGCCEIDTADRGKYYDEVPYSEYVQKTKEGKITKFWSQFPTTMIKKVAEESVLRMLAPEDLSGVYGDDEMQQADEIKEIPAVAVRQIAAETKILESSATVDDSIHEAEIIPPFLRDEPQHSAPVTQNGKTFNTFDPSIETVGFGKNRGMKWLECDNGWLVWCANKGLEKDKAKALATLDYLKKTNAQADQTDPLDAVFGKVGTK